MLRALKIPVQVQILLAIIIARLSFHYIPHYYSSVFYSFSLVLKEIIIVILPAIIISSIYRSLSGMKEYSILMVPLIIFFICTSNFIHVYTSFFVADQIFGHDLTLDRTYSSHMTLLSLWDFSLPRIISNQQALFLGFILGIIGYKRSFKPIEKIIHWFDLIGHGVLKRFFIPLLPVFIFGMMLKILNDGTFEMLANNMILFAKLILMLLSYIGMLLIVASGFSLARVWKILINILSPLMTAFSTMSSAVALPFSLQAAKANTKNPGFSDFFMPATVNIHMIGDCITIPSLIVIVMTICGMEVHPSQIMGFAMLFMVTKFSGAGVPGGTVLIMMPLMIKVFGFTEQMSLLITGIYILLDPVVTSVSVVSNNLFVVLIDRGLSLWRSKSRVR